MPDYTAMSATAGQAQATPLATGARGQLSPQQASAWVARLEKGAQTDLIARHLSFMEEISSVPIIVGNGVRLLIDGPATQAAMLKEIAQARRQINLQFYIFEDDEFGVRFADALIARRAAGVAVNVLYDSVGSISTDKRFFERMRAAGIRVCEFNPVNPLKGKGWNINQRDHRKIFLADGSVAMTGGINVSSVYSSGSASARRRQDRGSGWRDTQVEIRGPAVPQFQRLFTDTWSRARCGELSGPAAWPVPSRQGDKVVRVIASTPDDKVNLVYAEWLSALLHAERSIHLTMAYFVPDPQIIRALKDAAARGVDVVILLPGVSDFWAVLEAGRSHYADLLGAGVKIYERRDSLLHAKTAVIDGVWSTVGSTNLDWRSFLHNDEINAVILGESFGQEMEQMFRADLQHAVPITAEEWAQRGLAARAREWFARMWEYWL
jgi:cardiolipin synthase